jgi:hypothetical protein
MTVFGRKNERFLIRSLRRKIIQKKYQKMKKTKKMKKIKIIKKKSKKMRVYNFRRRLIITAFSSPSKNIVNPENQAKYNLF